jgi:hypothetical protein
MIKTAPLNHLAAYSSLREDSRQSRISYGRADADLFASDESLLGIKADGRWQTAHLAWQSAGLGTISSCLSPAIFLSIRNHIKGGKEYENRNSLGP